jgi:hypothetical protein
MYFWSCYFWFEQLANPSLKAVIGFFIGGLIMAYLIPLNFLKYESNKIFIGWFCIRNCTPKSEAVSWYRIYEMFQFQSFHMYGIFMTAIGTGIIGIQLIKRKNLKKTLKD